MCVCVNVVCLLNAQSLMPLMFGSLARLLSALVIQPAATISTILYYSDLLPRNLVINLDRLVRHEFLDPQNYFFNFLVNVMRCFW
ncbi:hypothetical protein LguiA_028657 [Lonicera macranthoides]